MLKNDARIDLRLSADAKHKIEQAASVSGQSLSDFAIAAMLSQAVEVLAKHQNTWLSDRDRDLFLALLDADEEPNERLRLASEKYKREHAGTR